MNIPEGVYLFNDGILPASTFAASAIRFNLEKSGDIKINYISKVTNPNYAAV